MWSTQKMISWTKKKAKGKCFPEEELKKLKKHLLIYPTNLVDTLKRRKCAEIARMKTMLLVLSARTANFLSNLCNDFVTKGILKL